MKQVFLMLLLSSSLLFAGCKGCSNGISGCPKIKELYDAPDDFQGKEVCLEGTTSDGTNLLVVKFYTLTDASGSIFVVTSSAVPNDGKKKQVYGRVNQYFKMPGSGSVMAIEEI